MASTRTRMRRWFMVTAVVVAVAFHSTILRTCSQFVIRDEPHINAIAQVDVICGGDGVYAAVANDVKSHRVTKVVVNEAIKSRLQYLGLEQAPERIAADQLAKAGVDADVIYVVNNNNRGLYGLFASVDELLRSEEDMAATVYCGQFNSARISLIADRCVAPTRRKRISVVPLRDRRFDETNWWRHRLGIRAFFSSCFSLAYTYIRGEEPPREFDCDPDQYESMVLAR